MFTRYLGDGKPGYVAHRWAKLADAVSWIQAAGGEAMIAHPGRYDYSPVEFDAFFAEFIELGGKAIEVVTGSHTPDQYREYADVARRFGFRASRGSDFHARRRRPCRSRHAAAAAFRSQARLGTLAVIARRAAAARHARHVPVRCACLRPIVARRFSA